MNGSNVQFKLFRCKFETKLLLSVENDVVDQSNVAYKDRDDDQGLPRPHPGSLSAQAARPWHLLQKAA